MIDLHVTYGIASIAVPIVVFLIVVGLAVAGKIRYGLLVTLLAFGLLSGFTIANYDVLGKMLAERACGNEAILRHIDERFDALEKRLESKPDLGESSAQDLHLR